MNEIINIHFLSLIQVTNLRKQLTTSKKINKLYLNF